MSAVRSPADTPSTFDLAMPVPWEAFIPFALLTVMFGAAGTLFGGAQRIQNQGKY